MEEVTGSIPVRSTDSLLIKRNINYIDFSGIIWYSFASSLTRIVEIGFREATNCFSAVHLNSEKAYDRPVGLNTKELLGYESAYF